MRLGWDGKGGTTLEAAGNAVGITRERVRQLVRRVADHFAAIKPQLPALEAAVEMLEWIAPARRIDAGARLNAAGLAQRDFDPAGVLEAAQMAGLNPRVIVAGSLVVTTGQRNVASRILEIARKLTTHNGAGHVGSLVDTIAEDDVTETVARRLLDADDDVVWLDDDREWFYLPTRQNRALNYLRKMLSVSPSLTLADVRDGLRRPARGRSINLPREVLRRFCQQVDWLEVNGDVVTTTISLDFREVLENTEETLVDVFAEHGPVLDRATAVGLAEEHGLDRNTAALYLGWSPVIERLAISRYALRGADVPAGTLEAMHGVDHRQRVQEGYGWTQAGRLWIGYTLSQAVVDTHVVGVPGALRDELSGRYVVQPAHQHLGDVATDGQNLWGLSRALRRYGAEAGDVLVLEFDLAAQQCFVHVGGPELLDRENRSPDALEDSSYADGLAESGMDALLPAQSELFHEQPTLHPNSRLDRDGSEQRADPRSEGVNNSRPELLAGTASALTTVEPDVSDSVERPEVMRVLLDQLDSAAQPSVSNSAAAERLHDGSGSVEQGCLEACVVPGCERPGKNKLGVRCRVWHEPSAVPGKKKTSALWAPDADAFLCDEHALGGAHITLIFEPDSSRETAVRVVAAAQTDARTRPIKSSALTDPARPPDEY